MADFYKILKADMMPGEPYTPPVPNAKPIQSYWCQVEGQEKPFMVGKQVRDDGQPALVAGQQIYGDLVYAKSQRGTEYWKFKSAQVPEGTPRPASTPAQAQAQKAVGAQPNMSAQMPDWFMPVANQIDYIFREMRKMDTGVSEEEKRALIAEDEAKAAKAKANSEATVSNTPLDTETQDMLDDIFGKTEPVEPEPEE